MIKTTRIDPPSKEDIEEFIEKIGDKTDRALLSLIFLTGARISETIRMIKKDDFSMDESDTHIVLTIHTKKRKKGIEIRKVPINRSEKLTMNILSYIETLQPEDVLFKFSRQRALKRLKKYNKNMWLHLFRHARATDVAPDLNDQEMVTMFGWSDARPATTYVHLKWKDLAKKI
jgi:integrase